MKSDPLPRLTVQTDEAPEALSSQAVGVRDAGTCIMELVRRYPQKPWCIVGKGPSCNRRHEVDWSRYFVLSLNHACRVVPAELALFADYEAFAACADGFSDQQKVVLPWYPRENCRPSRQTLADYALRDARLARLWREGRLYSFNDRWAGKPCHPRLNFICLLRFSAVAAFHLLIFGTVQVIYTLGIDGGVGYADGFDMADHLRNGRSSFDDQFEIILPMLARFGVRWVKLPDQVVAYEPPRVTGR